VDKNAAPKAATAHSANRLPPIVKKADHQQKK